MIFMKKQYEAPVVETIAFDVLENLSTSSGGTTTGSGSSPEF